jgi:AAA domain
MPYTGIDLDHCRNPATGALEPWAQHIVNALASYTEVSPSGRGVHLYVKGRLAGKGHKCGPIELYDRERYFTVTDDSLPGTPATIEDRQTVIEGLYVAMPIIAKLLADSGRREKFSRLVAGDTSGYGSPSEADLALCSLAGKVNASADQIDALMRLSGLYREKWDEMHGAQTYGQMTIAKALEGQEQHSGSSHALSAGDVVCLDTVQSVAVDWLWEPYLPLGMTVSLEGDPGTGKSTLTANLAAYVTTGRPFPGEGGPKREPRNVLFLQCEDDLAAICRPRLDAAGADVSRVYVLTVGVVGQDARIGQAITEYRPALVIVAPLQAYYR